MRKLRFLKSFTANTLLLLVLNGLSNEIYAQLNIVNLKSGQISGTTSADKTIHIFKGIPFAAPPVGDFRWKAPQPVVSWNSVKKYEEFAPSPVQEYRGPSMMYTEEFMTPKEPTSEDCLYLNIWTASKSNAEKRAVLLYIHGGAFMGGGGNTAIYDGESMARKGITYVTINYRLNIFGFMAHPELSAETVRHRQLWIIGPNSCTQMGETEHCSVWRLPRKCNCRWAIGGFNERQLSGGIALCQRFV